MKNVLRITAIFLATLCLFVAASCGKAPEKESGNGSPIPEKTAKPQMASGVITGEQLNSTYGKYFDWRVYEIRQTTSEIKPTDSGTAYYVSPNGNDKEDGKNPETAIRSLDAINKLGLKAGDVVYLERGGVWRGVLKCETEGVTYSAYGEGAKPEIYASPLDGANPEYWEETETPHVYKFTKRRLNNVGVIVFDDTEFGVKRFWETGNFGKKKPSELGEHLDFMVTAKSELYLRCEKGNPGEVWDKIEFNVGTIPVPIRADNITIDNICFKYAGGHCISGNDTSGLTVQNCEFGFIGGSMQGGEGSNVRYGNAVEIWGAAVDYTVRNNYFYEIYDSAATFQFRLGEETKNVKNVLFADNIFYHCTAAIEYWLASEEGTIDNFKIENNFLWQSGYGLGAQRPSRTGSISLTTGGMDNKHSGPVSFSDNIIAISSVDLIYVNPKSGHYPTLSGNTFIQYEGGRLGIYNSQKPIRFDENIQNVINSHLGDKTGVAITVK